MKVCEFVELLNECDPDLEVIIARDAYAHTSSPLDYLSCSHVYWACNAYSGAVYGEEQEEQHPYSKPALVLFPKH